MPAPLPNLSIDAERLRSHPRPLLRESATGPKGGLRRLALSDSDGEMRDRFVEWCKTGGFRVTVDEAGSIFARRAGQDDSLAPVVIGSHLDTQAAGGRFDGILGVLAGLEILRTLDDNGMETKRAIEVVNWTNEEGARFSPPMAASRVFAGLGTVEWLHDLKDDDGIRYGDELRRIGYLGEAPVGGRALDSYFELHIEQDSLLEEAGVSVGVVTGGYFSHALNCVFQRRVRPYRADRDEEAPERDDGGGLFPSQPSTTSAGTTNPWGAPPPRACRSGRTASAFCRNMPRSPWTCAIRSALSPMK